MKHSQLLHNRRPLGAVLAALLCLPLAPVTLLATAAPAAAEETAPTAPDARPEAFAYDEAARTGKRVEVIDRREERLEVFANPDGTTTQRSYATPVWTRLGGIWRKADATLQQQSDGTVAPAAPAFGITFSGGGDAPLATMNKRDKKLTLTWPAPLPEPVLNGNTALYESVLPGVDLKVIAEVDGFAEHLIINTPEAAANPALETIELGIAAEGLDVTVDASDSIIATDADGTVVFSAPRPKMWEAPPTAEPGGSAQRSGAARASAAEQPETAPVAVGIADGTLTLTPDPALLAGADQFPLVIDPPFTGGQREKWAVVYSATPGEAYPNGSGWHSGTPSDEPRVGHNGTGRTRSFFAMDTKGLAGAEIISATFAVSNTHSWGCSASQAGPTELWSTGDITNTPTWNSNDGLWAARLASDSYADAHPSLCPGPDPHEYSSTALTNYVRQAADSGWNVLTFGVRAASAYEGSTNSFKRFNANPALQIDYNFRPEARGAGAFEGSWSDGADGNKAVPCGDVIGNSSLSLKATLIDKDRGLVFPEFYVTTAAGVPVDVDVPNDVADGIATGRTASVTVRAANLPTGSYKWRMRARDGENTHSAYTPWCAFSVDRVGPEGRVTVMAGTDDLGDTTDIPYPSRTPLQIRLSHKAPDLAGFCWAMDHTVSVSSTRCANGNWVPAQTGGTANITVTPAGYPNGTLHVLAFDKADNHSPNDNAVSSYTIQTHAPVRVYAPGTDPTSGRAYEDLHGDLTGDGYVDMVATNTDADAQLRLYAGNGTGQLAAPKTVGTTGWGGALIAHGGDYRNLTSGSTKAPDGYEDFFVRLSNGQLYLYPNNGFGTPWVYERERLIHPDADSNDVGGWENLRHIVAPGDVDRDPSEGRVGAKDFLTIECFAFDDQDKSCTNAELLLYRGYSVSGGGANQAEPFDMSQPLTLGNGGWKDFTNLTVTDLVGGPDADGDGSPDGDGIMDLLARDPSTGTLYLYPGQTGADGVYKLGTRVVYGNGGWDLTRRPLITSPGNVQGTVIDATVQDPDTGEATMFRQFQPTQGESYSDFWATTPDDPNYVVNYVTGNGSAATTTCPTGCLLFYPGGPTTHRAPRLAGNGGWSTTITGIF
ncbi:hypothetical protein AB0957_22475 [Streptomyces zhihengii]|uniref:hypothetical protein n=1 Tax=Streptomyces zhihengii TaxID=1818004 RepID=UPI0034524782